MSPTITRQAKRFEPPKSDPYYELNVSLTQHLKRNGQELRGKNALDLGCGERPFEKFYELYNVNVTTCDVQQNSTGTVDHILDVESGVLPFGDSKFDFVCLFDVLEHIPNDVHAISEINRVLVPGGWVIISVPFMYRFHEIPDDYRRYTPTGIRYLLERGGFAVEEITPIGSAFFVTDTMLRETQSKFSKPGAKLLRRLAMKFFFKMRDPFDPCSVSPFAFFVRARKAEAAPDGHAKQHVAGNISA